MTKIEKAKLENLKRRMIVKARMANDVFDTTPYEYNRLPESIKRGADQDYGEAYGIYSVLAALNAIPEYPSFEDIK